MKSAPCKGCEERSIGCHAVCARYGAFADERAMIRAKHLAEATITAGHREQTEKNKKMAGTRRVKRSDAQ